MIGTVAFTELDVLDAMIERGGDRVRIAVDVAGRRRRDRRAGWQAPRSPRRRPSTALRGRGAGGFIYTSVDRDGTMSGPDTEALAEACASADGAPILYSGGIGSLEDLEAIAALPDHDVAGVIVGKALYERRFSVTDARLALGEDGA